MVTDIIKVVEEEGEIGRSLAQAMEAVTTGNKIATKEVEAVVTTTKGRILIKIEEEEEAGVVLITVVVVVGVSKTTITTIDVFKKKKLKNCSLFYSAIIMKLIIMTFQIQRFCFIFSAM